MIKSDLIDHLITECSLDNRITDGMFNPFIQEHMSVMIEKLLEINLPQEDIKEFVNKIVEGKYPERQAYNKEGFLVTFPTPDYKTQALSSGNYFNYDPTHGKGGMHLIKKAEPAVAQQNPTDQPPAPPVANTTQPTSAVAPIKNPAQQSTETPSPTVQSTAKTSIDTKPDAVDYSTDPVKPVQSMDTSNPPAVEPLEKDSIPNNTPPKNPQATDQSGVKQDKTPVEYGTGEPEGEPLDLTDFSAYKDPSLEWAHNQKWEKRDNGNYYDNKGTLRAVIGLDGSAVPATENDRVSLRKWIDKKRQERLPGEKM